MSSETSAAKRFAAGTGDTHARSGPPGRAREEYIESVDDERDTGDGYWVYLKPGYLFDSSTTFIHESTVAAVKKALSRIGKVQP